MMGRYNRHKLTIAEYSDAMEFIRNYWWNYQYTPKHKEIVDSILNNKVDETCVVKCREVGLTKLFIMLSGWLVIKSEKNPVNIAFIGHNGHSAKSMQDGFIELIDRKSTRLNSSH